MTDQLSVLVVDDQALFREIANSMFEVTGEFKVIAEAEDGVDAIAAYKRNRPDLVLMDIQMARMNGLDATREILRMDPHASVVLISMKADPQYSQIADEMGAIGFVAKRDLRPSSLKVMIDKARSRANAA
ncbi:MAG: response regulator transcription factor [Chloroflexi bacterium]|nr:response regulator transcription factor [Chloroflexota bacterium]MCH8101653.1 response regulator transcription factor [Chloroflexota bacterium]